MTPLIQAQAMILYQVVQAMMSLMAAMAMIS
jgi:hypothetical protein